MATRVCTWFDKFDYKIAKYYEWSIAKSEAHLKVQWICSNHWKNLAKYLCKHSQVWFTLYCKHWLWLCALCIQTANEGEWSVHNLALK